MRFMTDNLKRGGFVIAIWRQKEVRVLMKDYRCSCI